MVSEAKTNAPIIDNIDTATAIDKSQSSDSIANCSTVSYDTGTDNLIQSFSSVDNSARVVDNSDGVLDTLIQSFSSAEDTDMGSIEQGEFFLIADKKQAHIQFQTTTKVLVIGDSNLRLIENEKLKGRIPKNWTINCIPGANLSLVNKLLLELPKKTPMLTDIIISAGMYDNNITSHHLTTTLNTAISLKKRIHFQGIVINDKIFSDIQVENLTKINNNAKQHANVLYIKPPKTFSTTPDGIHYLAETVERIFYSMKIHIQHSKSLN